MQIFLGIFIVLKAYFQVGKLLGGNFAFSEGSCLRIFALNEDLGQRWDHMKVGKEDRKMQRQPRGEEKKLRRKKWFPISKPFEWPNNFWKYKIYLLLIWHWFKNLRLDKPKESLKHNNDLNLF